ncbi:hypothetical protein DPMN_153821 [Dreissena polymorpha]|uniref:Uncharacterized protein n=1 Tax=Dreissena polymorpha TaxID=45954 RepID=A0A9D4FQL9_DREPO|nr:hypothetical protein DPMN_153821 [Dreissena polymorpha]
MWGQLIIALACALEILAQDCVIPSDSQFSRATYRPYHDGTASGKTHYNAGERIIVDKWIRVVCNKDRQGDGVLNVSKHLCSAGDWIPTLPVCQALCNYECQNGGKCVSPDVCECPDGYNGLRCENVQCIFECQNGGKCVSPDVCECHEGYNGLRCENALCSPGCQNGGTCVSPDTCRCLDGFDGLHCENDIDECSKSDLNDCHHFSNCTNTQGNYTCNCIDGYVDLDDNRGRRCEALCNYECQNGGKCVSPDVCECPEGYNGLRCENALCSPGCQNGGMCESPGTCLCLDGFDGQHCENETKNCTLEAGQNVNYWHMSTNTTLSEGGKASYFVVHGTRIRVKCQNTGFDYSDYYNSDESPANMECVNGVFTDHGLNCESVTKSTPDSSPSTKNCTTIENGKITDRGKSFTCNADYQPSFKNGMDAILYARYSCTCNKRTGNVQCMGTEVECKPIGCKIPANVQQGMTLFDPKERRTISAANRYEIQHGQFLTFTCEPSDVFYFEPHRRIFECVKGLWVSKTRPQVDTWDFGNNGAFPECRKVVCPADYCKFGGHCIRDHECQCPEQTSGKQCETPLCSPGCQNGGTCESPHTCRCLDGFDGLHCENDIDECSKSDLNDCHRFSNCTNNWGDYTCTCFEGYVDLDGNRGRRCEETCGALLAPINGNVASGNNNPRFTCDAPHCLDEKKIRVCSKGPLENTTNVCLKGLRECSDDKYLINNDSTLSVSTQWEPTEPSWFGADQGRLNSTETGKKEEKSFRAGVWAAGVDNTDQYIQVNFTAPKIITGIATRGRPKTPHQSPQWVTQYRFMYSTDCVTFNNYMHTDGSDMIFSANVDGDRIEPNLLPCPVLALCARVNPTKWHDWISMAFEIMGCD